MYLHRTTQTHMYVCEHTHIYLRKYINKEDSEKKALKMLKF